MEVKQLLLINSDKEAPFFKSADYGIVGDAFDSCSKISGCSQKTLKQQTINKISRGIKTPLLFFYRWKK
jgi:hypothetical protein